jgi:hypothetical protein
MKGDLYQVTEKVKQQSYESLLLANYCMPTLLKIKPSSLIHVNKRNAEFQVGFQKLIQKEMEPFQSHCSVLYEDDLMYILMIYNRKLIEETITTNENGHFLASCGYDFNGDTVAKVIGRIQLRYEDYKKNNGNYPHEIGILLGYPIMDVKDFIRYHGKNYLYCGFWKVYHELDLALKIFDSYQVARERALHSLKAGNQLKDMLIL